MFRRFFLLVLLFVFLAPLTASAQSVVTSSVSTEFSTTITQPEVVNLSGDIQVVAHIMHPTDPCQPTDPCFGVPVRVQMHLVGVSGVGQTTGTRYHLRGSAHISTTINLPGGFVTGATFHLTPPNPITPPSPITVQVFLTADSSGNVSAPASQPQGLVSWWQAEGNANDALGVNNGTIQGAVSFVPGRVGQAFGFLSNSVPPAHVGVPGSPTLQPAAVTVMAWVKNSGSPGIERYILSEGAKGCFASAYALYTSFAGNLKFYVSDGGTFVESPDAPAIVWDGNWHFVAGTYDGASVRLYVDGTEVGSGTPTKIAIGYSILDNSNFNIGAYIGSCSIGFTGAVDEIRVFSRALGAAEILSIFQTTP